MLAISNVGRILANLFSMSRKRCTVEILTGSFILPVITVLLNDISSF